MRFYKLLIGLVLTFACTASSYGFTELREWTDANGHYTFKADLIAYDSEHVVLQKENKDLQDNVLEENENQSYKYSLKRWKSCIIYVND